VSHTGSYSYCWNSYHHRWLIDTDKDDEGLRVLADLNGGDLDNPITRAEFKEIKDKVTEERDRGEGRSYKVMWAKYKRRVILAMSSQAFAQLVCCYITTALSSLTSTTRMESMVCCLTERTTHSDYGSPKLFLTTPVRSL